MSVTVNGTEGITLDNGSADGAQVTLTSSGYSNWNLDNYSGRFRAYYNATEYFTINSSGNVGIGTSSPSAKLDVNGSIKGTITSGTAVSASGTSVDFTSIPSWVKRITVMFNEVSTSGTSVVQCQLGTGGTPTTSGYLSTKIEIGTGGSASSITSGHSVVGGSASNVVSGTLIFSNVSGNIWIGSSQIKQSTTFMSIGNSSVTLSGTLNMVRITTVNGTDTFDAGSINILYEG